MDIEPPALLDLERKTGRIYGVADWFAIERKAVETITDDDLTIIEAFGGKARAAKFRAQRQPAPVASTTDAKALPPKMPTPAAADALTTGSSISTREEFLAKHGKKPVTYRWLSVILENEVDEIIGIFKEHRDRLAALESRLSGAEREKANADAQGLEARIAALEKRPAVKFCGTWQRDKSYAVGDAATHHGGLWICQADTSGEPSKDFVGWRLAVKSGQR